MTTISRRHVLQALAISASTAPLFCAMMSGTAFAKEPVSSHFKLSEALMERAHDFLHRHISIDLHSHPGRFFATGDAGLDPKLFDGKVSPKRTIADMRAGGLTASFFSMVADLKLLGLKDGRPRMLRPFKPGEAYADYQRQFALLRKLASVGLIHPLLKAGDIEKAKAIGLPAAIYAMEGGSFLDQDINRVAQSHKEGLRSIQLVHYHVNQLGDVQTEAPVHNGLTEFGASVIKAMNQHNMIIDLAHATFATTSKAAEISTKPIIISHTNLQHPGFSHPRYVTLEHAKTVSERGGVIGAWPAGFEFHTLADFADAILRLIEGIGVDHTGIGSDMDGNYKPVFSNYRQLPELVALLFERGLDEQSVAKVMGGNMMRVLALHHLS